MYDRVLNTPLNRILEVCFQTLFELLVNYVNVIFKTEGPEKIWKKIWFSIDELVLMQIQNEEQESNK